MFPNRRFVALYGHPGTPSLGVLGEQDIPASIARVKDLAAQYQPFSKEPVVPAFEIIATVAAGQPGPDGNFSNEWPADKLRPWVDAAKEAGVYVVLDLQSGRTDSLDQAKLYESLLKEPHVGLALDPEWRLGPGEFPLQQIGQIWAEEINRTSEWLAQLTADNGLPQKVFILHQFRLDMLPDRQNVTIRKELATVIHADGQGALGDKMATWQALQQGLPKGAWLGWKNFYDEDSEMLTPERTMTEVKPTPWFVSYQ